MSSKKEDSIVLEPFTKITSFDGIAYAASRAIIGAIGRYLYPNDEDKPERGKFYSSPTGRGNKQKVTELTSEIYSYLNAIIAEYADPSQYYFRLWTQVEINRKTGEIIGHPFFDLDVFRYVGKVGGRHAETGGYALKAVFVGKKELPVSSVFIKGASTVARNTGMVAFSSYESYFSAPKEIRAKITKDAPYLIIENDVYEVKVKVEKGTAIVPYIEEEKETFEFRDEKSVALFLLKRMKVKPKIIGSETGFEYVDNEIKNFSPKIGVEDKAGGKAEETFGIESLGIEETLGRLLKKLDELDSPELPEELQKLLKKNKKTVEGAQHRYEYSKARYEAIEQEMGMLQKERLEGSIDEDKFLSTRTKRLTALKLMKTEFVNLQQEVKSEILGDANEFLKQVRKTQRREKANAKE